MYSVLLLKQEGDLVDSHILAIITIVFHKDVVVGVIATKCLKLLFQMIVTSVFFFNLD